MIQHVVILLNSALFKICVLCVIAVFESMLKIFV